MKRRRFLHLAIASAGTAVLPMSACRFFGGSRQPIDQPITLSRICEESSILEIGKAYQSMEPIAGNVQQLKEALLMDFYGKIPTGKDTDEVPLDVMEKRIAEDFRKNLIVYPAGWILSRTEARQCALYSLTA